MKAITLHQPYAQAIFAGLKHYETRSLRTHYRGDLAIHAGMKAFTLHDAALLVPTANAAAVEIVNRFEVDYTTQIFKLTYGAVLGIVRVVDCVPVEAIRDDLTDVERAFGDYSDGRFAWVLDNVRPFDKPIPAKGQLGLWTWKGSDDE